MWLYIPTSTISQYNFQIEYFQQNRIASIVARTDSYSIWKKNWSPLTAKFIFWTSAVRFIPCAGCRDRIAFFFLFFLKRLFYSPNKNIILVGWFWVYWNLYLHKILCFFFFFINIWFHYYVGYTYFEGTYYTAYRIPCPDLFRVFFFRVLFFKRHQRSNWLIFSF